MVTLSVPVWGTLFVTLSRYEPLNPDGSDATMVELPNDTKDRVVRARVTVGATPAGLKFAPVMVSRFPAEFTTPLLTLTVPAAKAVAVPTNTRVRNARSALPNLDRMFVSPFREAGGDSSTAYHSMFAASGSLLRYRCKLL
jgi:hypothetical protein